MLFNLVIVLCSQVYPGEGFNSCNKIEMGLFGTPQECEYFGEKFKALPATIMPNYECEPVKDWVK